VANYLLELGQSAEARPGWVTLPAKKATIAGRIGITPETLSRVLRRLREAGIIAIEGRHLRILDMDILKQRACG